MGQFAIGQSVPREEDPRLLRGEGEYIADLVRPAHGHGPCAALAPRARAHRRDRHARGEAMPGVLGVFTEADLAADGLGTMRCRMPRKRPDGSPMHQTPHPGLARGFAHFVGDPVAYVVAETRDEAKDAAEAIAVNYEPLPSVVLTADATQPGAPAVWADCPDNDLERVRAGRPRRRRCGLCRAHHVTRQHFVISRIAANAMEPRGCLGEYDARTGRYTLYGRCSGAHVGAQALAEDDLQGSGEPAPRGGADIGGAFGSKGATAPGILRDAVGGAEGRAGRSNGSPSAARRLISDDHGRDNVTDAELALDQDGRFLALAVRTLCQSRRLSRRPTCQLSPTFINLGGAGGRLSHPGAFMSASPASSPTRHRPRPIAAPAGRRRSSAREASSTARRASWASTASRSAAATSFRRRRCRSRPASSTPTIAASSSKNMDKALALARLCRLRDAARGGTKRGKLLGLGIATRSSGRGRPVGETAEIRFDPTGARHLFAGTHRHGQGHETMYKIILSDRLGIDASEIRLSRATPTRAVGRRHVRLALGGARRLGGRARRRKDHRQGQQYRRAHPRSGRSRHRIRRTARFTVAGTDRAVDLERGREGRASTPRCRPAWSRASSRPAVFDPHGADLPQWLPCLRGRNRPRHRHADDPALSSWSTMSAP